MPKAPRRSLELVQSKLATDDLRQCTTATKENHALGRLVLQNSLQPLRPGVRDIAQRMPVGVEYHHQITRLEPHPPALAGYQPARSRLDEVEGRPARLG